MYPARLGFKTAIKRINALRKNGHKAEALVTSVFTTEKLMRRSMRFAIKARGFTSKHANHLLDRKSFHDIKELWSIFDVNHTRLDTILAADWPKLVEAVTMRNKLVHGVRTYRLSECDQSTARVIKALRSLHKDVKKRYGRDPWDKQTGRRKPQLHWIG